jgi:hypothetical protein
MKKWLKIWTLLDGLYFSCSRLHYVNQEENNIFRVKLITYRGRKISLANGNWIQANDLMVKIHLHNCLLMSEIAHIKSGIKRALYIYQRVESSLPGLADFIAKHPKAESIKGILGVTILSRGVEHLGFEVKEIPNLYYQKMRQLYMKPLFILSSSNHIKGSWKKDKFVPKFLVMSKDQIFSRYLQEA